MAAFWENVGSNFFSGWSRWDAGATFTVARVRYVAVPTPHMAATTCGSRHHKSQSVWNRSLTSTTSVQSLAHPTPDLLRPRADSRMARIQTLFLLIGALISLAAASCKPNPFPFHPPSFSVTLSQLSLPVTALRKHPS